MSDDYVLSHCVRKVAKRKIQFVPRCLVASDANFNWASLFEFAVRQYRITKVCEPWVWLTAIGGAAVYLTAFGYTLFKSVYGFTQAGALSGDHLNLMVMFCGLYAASIVRGYMLVTGGMKLLPEHREEIGSTMVWATVGLPWCYFINLVALAGSAVGKNVVWRGVAYQMVSRTKTIVQRPHVGVSAAAGQRERAEV